MDGHGLRELIRQEVRLAVNGVQCPNCHQTAFDAAEFEAEFEGWDPDSVWVCESCETETPLSELHPDFGDDVPGGIEAALDEWTSDDLERVQRRMGASLRAQSDTEGC